MAEIVAELATYKISPCDTRGAQASVTALRSQLADVKAAAVKPAVLGARKPMRSIPKR